MADRQHEEMIDVLRSIRRRVGWALVLLIALAIGSCTAVSVYLDQQGRARTSRY